jgi:uncharacterized phiE125 gp8 family phage protein
MAELKLVEGWTGPIQETLTKNAVAQDLTGMTVALLLHRADGSLVSTTGNVTVPTPAAGLVQYSPDPTDLLASETPHVARWKVTDGAGKVSFFPSEEGEVWFVLPTAAFTLQDNALLTFAELRHALAIKGNDQDLFLAQFINTCSDALETQTGRRLKSRTYTDLYRRVWPDKVLAGAWLDLEWPITTLAAVEIDGTVQTLWMPGDAGSPEDKDVYVLDDHDPKHGRDRLHKTSGWCGGELVKLTYTAGYGVVGPPAFPIPGDLKQAIVVLARDWYYLRDRQAQNVQSRAMQGEAVTYINDALPRQFRALINSYRRWSA